MLSSLNHPFRVVYIIAREKVRVFTMLRWWFPKNMIKLPYNRAAESQGYVWLSMRLCFLLSGTQHRATRFILAYFVLANTEKKPKKECNYTKAHACFKYSTFTQQLRCTRSWDPQAHEMMAEVLYARKRGVCIACVVYGSIYFPFNIFFPFRRTAFLAPDKPMMMTAAVARKYSGLGVRLSASAYDAVWWPHVSAACAKMRKCCARFRKTIRHNKIKRWQERERVCVILLRQFSSQWRAWKMVEQNKTRPFVHLYFGRISVAATLTSAQDSMMSMMRLLRL